MHIMIQIKGSELGLNPVPTTWYVGETEHAT